MPFFDQRFQRFGRREVYLVHHYDGRYPAPRYFAYDFFRAVALFHRVRHIQNHVRVGQGSRHEFHHRLLQFVARFQNSRRVRVDDLEVVARDYAHDAVARRLRFRGDDREFFAHQRVHQRRFPYVRIPDDVYKARFVHFLISRFYLPKVGIYSVFSYFCHKPLTRFAYGCIKVELPNPYSVSSTH